MKDRLRSILDNARPHDRLGVLREFLQCVMLRAIHERHRFENIAFVGGTALRLIYDIPRFSEDLDFSLIQKKGHDFKKMLSEIKQAFSEEGMDVEVKVKREGIVQNGWFSFPHLLHEIGLSVHPRQKLSIKIEIDTNPPTGARIERSLVNRHFPLAIAHYDMPSLFAGKLHALLQRAYVKGRDYYDLVWFMTKQKTVEPNMTLLNAALKQTEWKGDILTLENWRQVVRERIEGVDWNIVVNDVSPFLEDERDLDAMKLDYVLPLLK